MIHKIGDTIELISMDNDPHPLEAGDKGEVYSVTPCGNDEIQICVNWESGRKLHLIHPVDKFKIIKQAE